MHALYRSSRASLVLVAVSLGIVGGLSLGSASHASAAISSCRRDPMVYLSNRTVVRLTTMIAAPSYQVREVFYRLDVPRGTRVTRIVYPGGNRGEILQVSAGNATNTYDSTTFASSSLQDTAVTATMTVQGESHGSASTHGVAQQVLLVHVRLGEGPACLTHLFFWQASKGLTKGGDSHS